MLDLNYVIGNDGKKSSVSATGTIIQRATITTSGFPVQITVTGDGEPGGAGWQRLQIFRQSMPLGPVSAIGEVLHIETAGSGLNMTVALSTIDTPVGGTYEYTVKLIDGSGVSVSYSEVGQLSMIVEEKIISSRLSSNWLRRDISPPNVYYGYSNNLSSGDGDSTWSIKKVTTTSVESVTWTNGNVGYVSTWDNRVESFQVPSTPLNVTYNVLDTPDSFNSNRKTLSISWDLITGVDIYKVIVTESGKIYNNEGYQVYDNPNFNDSPSTSNVINRNSYGYIHAQPGLTYSITVSGSNIGGVTSSTINITT